MAEFMRYKDVPHSTRQDLEQALTRNDEEAAQSAILGLALHDRDWKWVQERCLALMNHPSWPVRAAAAACLGHLARIHRTIDLDRTQAALRTALQDPQVASYAELALDDIETFVHAPTAHGKGSPTDP